MSRWNDTITLLSDPVPTQDAGGSWHRGEREETTVFCNALHMGLAASTAAVDMGLRPTARVSVRSMDYAGQERAYYPARADASDDMAGRELDVIATTGGGEFVTLTLGRRIDNA